MSTNTIEVIVTEGNNYIIEVGIQGPPGTGGSGSGGGAIIQDSQPLTGTEGQLWFNDSTDILKVYANGVWQTQTMDDEYF